MPWFEEDPGRRALELRNVQEVDRDAIEDVSDGLLTIKTKARYRGEDIPIAIEYPVGFPFVPPLLFGPPRLIERHQNPGRGNFCLIDNEEHWWRPDYTASVLLEELQRLLAADERGEVDAGERDMPEPLSGHLAKWPDLVVIVFEEATLLDLAASEGSFVIERINDHQWALTELSDAEDRVLAAMSNGLRSYLRLGRLGRASGHWTSCDEPLPTDENTLVEAAAHAMAETRGSAPHGSRRRDRLWSAVTFKEQGPRRGEVRRNWFFCEATTGRNGGIAELHYPIATQAISRGVRNARLRELVGLEARRFLVLGAGAIGGQLTIELAKAGVGYIDLVDGDIYDTGNAVRHPLPLYMGGLGKAEQVAALAQSYNPFTRLAYHDVTVGRTQESDVLLRRLVEEADVVVEATGFHTMTRLLHHQMTGSEHLGLVSAALSVGGYGGRLVLLRERSPCFDCFLLNEAIPRPQEGPIDNETPYGCSHPAASCAGFDALELVANAARAAVRLVPEISYPPLDFDWAVINFRPGAERWTQGALTVSAECPWCNR